MIEREPLPTREMIDALTDRPVLEAILAEVEAAIAKMKVDLEFRTAGDDDWERRCRGALTAHEIVKGNLKTRIHRLFAKSPQVEADAANRASKAQRRAAAAVEAEAAATRKAARAEETRQRLTRERLAAIERLNFLADFYTMAKSNLPADVFATLSAATVSYHAAQLRSEARTA